MNGQTILCHTDALHTARRRPMSGVAGELDSL